MSSKTRKEVDPDSFSDDPQDYLLDPDLWLDKLPQPFQMIDDVLQEFLDQVWEKIESREIIRKQEEARVKVPELSGGLAIAASEGVKLISTSNGGAVFMASHAGLTVLGHPKSSDTSTLERITYFEWSNLPTSIDAGQNKDVSLIAVAFENEVKLFAYTKKLLIHLTDITMEEDEGSKVISITVSPSWTHLSFAASHNENSTKLNIYQLPLSSWHSEIGLHLEQLSPMGGVEGTQSQISVTSKTSKQQEDIVFSKPTLVCALQPPSPLSPCPATDPAAAIQRVLEDSQTGICIPSGDLHILSQTYLDNRRKAFVSQRPDFVEEKKESVTYTHSTPKCHYLFYKNSFKQVTPCCLAVWWQRHTQLLIYPICDSLSKTPPQPNRVLPNTSVIVCSAVNTDSSMLALGLENGVVIVWSMKTDLCTTVCLAVEQPDSITCMDFCERPMKIASQLAVGSKQGKIFIINTNPISDKQAGLSLGQRVSKQKELYPELFKYSAYNIDSEVTGLKFVPNYLPSVVISIHDDGSVVVWNSAEHEALCKVVLPHMNVAFEGQHNCAVSGGLLLIIGELSNPKEQAESITTMFSFDLQASPILSPHWSVTHTPSHHHSNCYDETCSGNGMFGAIDNYLNEYIKTRNVVFKKDKEKWQKRWTELPQILISRQTVTT